MSSEVDDAGDEEVRVRLNDNVDPASDRRPWYFADAPWFAQLPNPERDRVTAWYLAKGEENDWSVQLMNVALQWADSHGLAEIYRTRFAGVPPVDVQPQRAEAEHRLPSFPLWQIANELVVGCYLERVLGWRYEQHEPPGRQRHRGEWQFTTRSNRAVFVEVKSLKEADWSRARGVFSRPDYRGRVISTLAEAYPQLPDDGRATLVVIVGDFIVSLAHSIMLGDIYQTLFGQFQVRFPIGADFATTKMRAGPSFHDMFVQRKKNRRLGCVAGLVVRGFVEPRLLFYAIQNPFAHESVRLPGTDLERAHRFVWDDDGNGSELPGLPAAEVWPLMLAEK